MFAKMKFINRIFETPKLIITITVNLLEGKIHYHLLEYKDGHRTYKTSYEGSFIAWVDIDNHRGIIKGWLLGGPIPKNE